MHSECIINSESASRKIYLAYLSDLPGPLNLSDIADLTYLSNLADISYIYIYTSDLAD